MTEVSGLKVLDDVKDSLGLAKDDDSFNTELLMHINAAFIFVNQAGAGVENLVLTKDTVWDDLVDQSQTIGNKSFSIIKQYIFTKVKVLFDPPQSSVTLDVFNSLVEELLWRIRLAYEPEGR